MNWVNSDTTYGPGTNSGHGHVWERPDGNKARCGGPSLCEQCAADAARFHLGVVHNPAQKTLRDEYAMAAIPGVMTAVRITSEYAEADAKVIAELALAIADAAMAKRGE